VRRTESYTAPGVSRRKRPDIRLIAAGVLLSLLVHRPAGAYDFEVSARTEGHGYQLRRYEGNSIAFLNRRRITQYLGVRIFNLLGDGHQPRGATPPPLLYLHGLMRFDTDFGGYVQPSVPVREIENNQFDLMLGALEGRNLLRGWLDFTLGRQYDGELLDFFAFDGLRVRLCLPKRLFIESFFGAQVDREHPFSAAVFETDGTSGDASDDAIAPTFGLAGGVEDLAGFALRVAYRGTASKAPAGLVSETATEGEPFWGIDQELVFVSLSYRVPVLETQPLFGMRYNILTDSFDDVQVGLSQRVGEHQNVRLELLRSRPHFDGDSIFNLFAVEPWTEVAGSYALRLLGRRLELTARCGYRRFFHDEEEGDSAEPDAISAGLGARWRSPRLAADLDLHYVGGLGTTTAGGDAFGQWTVVRWLALEGRVSLIASDDSAYSDDVTNFGLQVGGQLRLFRGVKIHVLLEDNISRLQRSALRLLGVLDLEFAP